jgi:hypothetical protein
MLSLTMRVGSEITLFDADGARLCTLRCTAIKPAQVRIAFDVIDAVEVVRDANICECAQYEAPHPVWWCSEEDTVQKGEKKSG